MPPAKPTCIFEPIEELMIEAITAKVVEESVRLKLFDHLEDPKMSADIGKILKTNTRITESLLDVLEAKGLVTRNGETYVNTPLAAEFLVSGSPFWQGEFLLSHRTRHEVLATDLSDLLRGRARAPKNVPARKWSSIEALTTLVQFSLQGTLQDMVNFILALPGFPAMRRMSDIGGNHGRYAMTLLDENPGMSADVLDMPSVVPTMEALFRDAGYGARLSAQPFDLRHDCLPDAAYDLVLVSHVLHMFAKSLPQVAKTIAAGTAPGGWFVSQTINPDGMGSPTVKSVRQLTTRMMGVNSHWLTEKDLETMRAALSDEGFGDFVVCPAGPNETNLIFAARKAA